jgi:hypothetical protein
VVEEQEGVGLVADARGYGAKQTHARAFDGGLWFMIWEMVLRCSSCRRGELDGIT